MNLKSWITGPTCTEALNEAEEAGKRKRGEGNSGGDRVEWKVRFHRYG